jgi:hypothetical protein
VVTLMNLSIRSAEREIFSGEELSKSTEVTTEAACAYNEVESEQMPPAHVNNSQLELYNMETVQKTDLSEEMQEVSNINREEKLTEPDSNNSEREPITEVVSSSTKPDQSEENKTQDVVVCRDADGNSREREMGGKTIRICADERKINQCTVLDRERTPPMQELL